VRGKTQAAVPAIILKNILGGIERMNVDESWLSWNLIDSIPGMVLQSGGTILILEMVVFIVCLFVSGVLSGSETALTSMSKLRVKRLFKEEGKAYQKLELWLQEPNRFLVTILIGNNFVNILASVLAAHMCERYLASLNIPNAIAFGSALAVAVTTLLLLVFGEILPKTFCKEHAVRVSLAVIGPLDTVSKMIRPVTAVFIFMSNTVLRIFGGKKIKEIPFLTEEDIKTLIEVSGREGVLEPHETEMIANIIEFDERPVKEIMTPRIDFKALPLHMSLQDVMKEVVQCGHSRMPVFENDLDHIKGILYAKDLLKIDIHDQSIQLNQLIRPAIYIPNTKKMDEALIMFRSKKTHLAVVVDEYGTTDGLVTIEDLLEEIVGDIQDEFDTEESEYEIKEDGQVIADAKINLDELAQIVDTKLETEEVETLGGFISQLIGSVPKAGEKVLYENLEFTVLDADEKRIRKVQIKINKIPKGQVGNTDESIPNQQAS